MFKKAKKKAKKLVPYDGERVYATDVEDILDKMGFSISWVNLYGPENGAVIIVPHHKDEYGKSDKIIIINKDRGDDEARMILARLLGNYLLNYKESKKEIFIKRENLYSLFAHPFPDVQMFAENLLMPAEPFIDKFYELNCQGFCDDRLIETLSYYFGVPRKVALQRTYSLGLRNRFFTMAESKDEKACDT